MRTITFNADGTRTVTDNRTLADAQAEAFARIDAEFAARIAAGMQHAGRPVEIDEASTARMNAAASLHLAGIFPAGFEWRMGDNGFLPITGPQMVALAAAAAARVLALRKARWAARDAIRAATTREAADAVTATWP
jgi:hypothetical protein